MRHARVVTISDSSAADLQRYGVTVSAVVPPGSDLPESIAERTLSSPPRLVFAGRLNRTKRPGDALRALSLIREEFPGATLDVIGTGYLFDELRRQAADGGALLHGYISDEEKARVLRNADLILIPGTREGWGIVALEAAGHGVPAIAYDIPGLRDAVVDGVTGLLTERSPEAMAAASVGLLRSPSQWLRLRSAARQRALEFSWERAADGLMDALLIDRSDLLTDAA
jgi:glycosyltransferase involved in cell wall biosynthesis